MRISDWSSDVCSSDLVVDAAPADRGAVFFGAHVEVEDADSGEAARYRIVGPDETDAARGWISIDSPLARAMLKKRVDDEFEAQLPGGARRFFITGVDRSEEHTSELQSLMRISYAVFCLKKKTRQHTLQEHWTDRLHTQTTQM